MKLQILPTVCTCAEGCVPKKRYTAMKLFVLNYQSLCQKYLTSDEDHPAVCRFRSMRVWRKERVSGQGFNSTAASIYLHMLSSNQPDSVKPD
jgi:hypothetical protein